MVGSDGDVEYTEEGPSSVVVSSGGPAVEVAGGCVCVVAGGGMVLRVIVAPHSERGTPSGQQPLFVQ